MQRPGSRNSILARDDVGIAKPSTRILPEFGHSYGLPSKGDDEGVQKRKFELLNLIYYSHQRVGGAQIIEGTQIRIQLQGY